MSGFRNATGVSGFVVTSTPANLTTASNLVTILVDNATVNLASGPSFGQRLLTIVNASTTDATINPDGSDTIEGAGSYLLPADQSVQFTPIGTDWQVVFISTAGGGVSDFVSLTDTPASYSGQGGKFVAVKGTEDGLEFAVGGGGGAVDSVFGRVGVVTALEGDYSIDQLSDVDTTTTAPLQGDILVYQSGSGNWENIPSASAVPVTSVFGRTGSVVATEGDYSLDQLGDVDTTTSAPSTGDLLEWDGSNWVPVTPSAGVFGDGWQSEEDDSTRTRSSATFAQAQRMTTPVLPAGTYRIGWATLWRVSDTSGDGMLRIQVNDTTTLMSSHSHDKEAKDSGSDQREHFSNFDYYVNGSSQALNIDMDFARGSNGTMTLYWSRLEIFRVA